MVCFCSASSELNGEMSSIGEEGSDWDLNSEVAMVTGVGGSSKGSPQAEKEIRYTISKECYYLNEQITTVDSA